MENSSSSFQSKRLKDRKQVQTWSKQPDPGTWQKHRVLFQLIIHSKKACKCQLSTYPIICVHDFIIFSLVVNQTMMARIGQSAIFLSNNKESTGRVQEVYGLGFRVYGTLIPWPVVLGKSKNLFVCLFRALTLSLNIKEWVKKEPLPNHWFFEFFFKTQRFRVYGSDSIEEVWVLFLKIFKNLELKVITKSMNCKTWCWLLLCFEGNKVRFIF